MTEYQPLDFDFFSTSDPLDLIKMMIFVYSEYLMRRIVYETDIISHLIITKLLPLIHSYLESRISHTP